MNMFGAALFINGGLLLLLGGVFQSKTLVIVAFILGLCAMALIIPGVTFAILDAPYDTQLVIGGIILYGLIGTAFTLDLLSFISYQEQ